MSTVNKKFNNIVFMIHLVLIFFEELIYKIQ